MILQKARYRVLLPQRLLNPKDHAAIMDYMENGYKNYNFLFLEGEYAICERKESK